MKKFIGKLILFLLIVLTPLLTLNYLYKAMSQQTVDK